MTNRPKLDKKISHEDFSNYYWLKKELLAFCKEIGLPQRGGKMELTNRINTYLKTGKKELKGGKKKYQPTSNFDWKNEILTLQTVITDNYKNSENVRAFFQNHIQKKFKFNVSFMNWMKTNIGKTLEDAIQAWEIIEFEKKNRKGKKEIAPQFEYNIYIRDFLADNPDLSRKSAIEFWKLKKSMKGDNVYKKSDLDLENKS